MTHESTIGDIVATRRAGGQGGSILDGAVGLAIGGGTAEAVRQADPAENAVFANCAIDRIVPEPLGGAHRAPAEAIASLKQAIVEELDGLGNSSPEELRKARRAKFLAIA